MALDINSQFDLHTRALGLANQRLELLADNVANADTPNYKARDIDFRTALADAGAPGSALPLAATNRSHIATSGSTVGGEPGLLYRTPLAPSLDGNTVDAHLEQSSFAENAVRYQATLTFLGARFRSLMTAITGQ